MPEPTCQTSLPIHRGYIEGYYGQLLGWEERAGLIDHLARLSFDSYLYAPKEDIYHRWQWRTGYPSEFMASFHRFSNHAKSAGIHLLAGIAPGLDFDFQTPEADTNALFAKAAQLRAAGADAIVLMFDDISDDLTALTEAGLSEGVCHARLANDLQIRLGCPVLLVPRLYSDEISGDHLAYGTALNRHLSADISVLLCGETIVAKEVNLHGQAGQIGNMLARPIVIWDNLYCNDYCPRRLFLAPYDGRDAADPILLNGTGLYHTDKLLLSLMTGMDQKKALSEAGVPEAIEPLLPFFGLPVFSGQTPPEMPDYSPDAAQEALEILLWQWKSPLAREWYPFLFGLKQDIQIETGQMPVERQAKTQSLALFTRLQKDRK